jgi:hypothetical protein
MKLPSLDAELGAKDQLLVERGAPPFFASIQSLVLSSAMSRICSPKAMSARTSLACV